MADITATTELEAVNLMLSCINESPVSTLEVSGVLDVASARSILTEVSRNVQEAGWHFNSEDDYPLIRQTDGTITLPPNVAKVDTMYPDQDIDVVQRGNRLYNKTTHSYAFTKDLTVEIVFFLPWEELPQAARSYIAAVASRVFQARTMGSQTKYKFSEEDVLTALAGLMRSQVNNTDANMLSDSWSVANILVR